MALQGGLRVPNKEQISRYDSSVFPWKSRSPRMCYPSHYVLANSRYWALKSLFLAVTLITQRVSQGLGSNHDFRTVARCKGALCKMQLGLPPKEPQ